MNPAYADAIARTKVIAQRQATAVPLTPSDELTALYTDIADGRVYNVPFSSPLLTKMTNALLPGSIGMVCGDPGVGKTFFVLENLRHWHDNGYDAAVFFIEKDRRFHTMRLLAQLEGKGCFVDYAWLKDHRDDVREAMDRHRATIDALGQRIHSNDGRRVTLSGVLDWVRTQARGGRRVIVVDPITAASTGAARWTEDDEFVLGAERIMSDHGSSLLLMTHPKPNSSKNGKQTGHDQAGGAAFNRFVDSVIWMHRPQKPKKVMVQTRLGLHSMTLKQFWQLHKTRNGKGGGMEIGVTFGDGLCYAEQGVVVGDAQGEPDDGPPPDPFATTPRAPRVTYPGNTL